MSPPQLCLEYIRAIDLPIDRIELYEFIVTTFAVAKPENA